MSQHVSPALPTWERNAAGVAAAVFVLAWIVGLGIGFSFPSPDASGKEWIDFLRAHESVVVLQQYLIHGIAAIALIVFGSALYTLMRGAGAVGALPAVALAGAIAAAGVSLMQATVVQVAASKTAEAGDTSLVTSLLAIESHADTYKLLCLILLVVCASAALSSVRVAPRWLVWGGVLVGALLLLGSWSFPINFPPLTIALDLSLLALLAWMAVVAVFVVRFRAPVSRRSSARPS